MDLDDIVSELSNNLDYEDLLELIKQINIEVSDYDFTKKLKDYFVKEIENNDFDISED